MKYGKMGSCKGPGYSTGKSMGNTDLSQSQSIKVGRSAGLKMSNLSDHAAMSNKAGLKMSGAADSKNRRGQ